MIVRPPVPLLPGIPRGVTGLTGVWPHPAPAQVPWPSICQGKKNLGAVRGWPEDGAGADMESQKKWLVRGEREGKAHSDKVSEKWRQTAKIQVSSWELSLWPAGGVGQSWNSNSQRIRKCEFQGCKDNPWTYRSSSNAGDVPRNPWPRRTRLTAVRMSLSVSIMGLSLNSSKGF